MALAFSCHQFIWRLASVCWFPGGNKSHIHSLQSVLQLLLVKEGAAGVSSMTVRMQTLVCRASPLQHLLGMSQAQWPSALMQPGLESPTRDQMSGEEHPACASWKRPKEGWPLVKQQALDLVKYIPSISYQRSHTQGVPLPHLFIKLARWVRRWKHLLACLTCEGVMPPCGWGSWVTFSSPEVVMSSIRDLLWVTHQAGCRHVVEILLCPEEAAHLNDADALITSRVALGGLHLLPLSLRRWQLGRFLPGQSCLYFSTLSLISQVWFYGVYLSLDWSTRAAGDKMQLRQAQSKIYSVSPASPFLTMYLT